MERPPPPLVVARDLEKRVRDGLRRRTVIDRVSFTMDRGEATILRGPSGSGKTTLLALLGAMLSPTSGEVWLDGEATSRLRDAHRTEVRRKLVGFVFQDLQLIDEMSVLDNVLLPRVPDGVRPADRARAEALLERFGVASFAREKARALSGGERQRVAIARALLRDPKLLLLDEPTAHLDADSTRLVGDALFALAAEGRAVLIATHDDRLANDPRATRTVTIRDGKIDPQPAPREADASPNASDGARADAAVVDDANAARNEAP